MLEKKKPFVYELGGELYLIGMNVCVKLLDAECQSCYEDYQSILDEAAKRLAQKIGLDGCTERLGDDEWEDLPTMYQCKIGEALNKLEARCFQLAIDHNTCVGEYQLNLELEEKYRFDVEKQYTTWKRADDYRTVNCAVRIR